MINAKLTTIFFLHRNETFRDLFLPPPRESIMVSHILSLKEVGNILLPGAGSGYAISSHYSASTL